MLTAGYLSGRAMNRPTAPSETVRQAARAMSSAAIAPLTVVCKGMAPRDITTACLLAFGSAFMRAALSLGLSVDEGLEVVSMMNLLGVPHKN